MAELDLNPALSHSKVHAFNPAIFYAFVHTIASFRNILSFQLCLWKFHPSFKAQFSCSHLLEAFPVSFPHSRQMCPPPLLWDGLWRDIFVGGMLFKQTHPD